MSEPNPDDLVQLNIKSPLPPTFGKWRVVGSAMYDLDRQRPIVRVECGCGQTTRSVDLRDLRGGRSTQCRKCRDRGGRAW